MSVEWRAFKGGRRHGTEVLTRSSGTTGLFCTSLKQILGSTTLHATLSRIPSNTAGLDLPTRRATLNSGDIMISWIFIILNIVGFKRSQGGSGKGGGCEEISAYARGKGTRTYNDQQDDLRT